MEKVKLLRELSKNEFNKLKESGLLKTIYPDSPETYEEIHGIRPKPKTNPDFSSLIKMCEEYLDDIRNRDDDFDHYLYQEVITCVYGYESGIWDYINLNS
jgi:hypothetical protein